MVIYSGLHQSFWPPCLHFRTGLYVSGVSTVYSLGQDYTCLWYLQCLGLHVSAVSQVLTAWDRISHDYVF